MLTRIRLLLVAISCFFSTASFAQNREPIVYKDASSKEYSFGLKGGLNLANIGGDSRGTSMKSGLHLGFFASFPLSKDVSLQSELVYSVQGAKAELSGPTGDLKIHYNYVNVPVMLKVYPFETFNIQFGPQFGFLTSAKVTDGTNSQKLQDQLNKFDVGIGFGICNEFRGGASLGVRYNLGLTSTTKDDVANKNGSQVFPNRVIQISVGFVL